MTNWRPALFRLLDFPEVEAQVAEADQARVVGESQEGRPIHHLRIGCGQLRLLIVAGIHGTEPAPVNACLLLPSLLQERYPLGFGFERLRQVEVHIVPLANPNGLARNYHLFSEKGFAPHWSHVWEEARFTASGEDINGDWMRLSLPETQAVHTVFNEVVPHVVLDLHEFYAKGGCPPRWADETEGFLATVTDAPYRFVHPAIQEISALVAAQVAERVDWKPKMRHFLGGASEDYLVPPTCLGSHLPYEGAAKVLVETWGTALGPYLLPDRVMVHLQAVLATIEFMESHAEELLGMKEEWAREEEGLGRGVPGFRVRGEEVTKAERILSAHGLQVKRQGDELLVPMPQPRSRMALLLLDEDCEHNRLLSAQGKGPYTIDRFLRVEVEAL